jgi:phosphoribosylamine-glycine ligase
MITAEGPKVLGYKANFGETEAAAVIPLLGWDSNLEEIMMACVQGRLMESTVIGTIKNQVDDRRSAVVILTEAGSPEANFYIPRNIRRNVAVYLNRGNASTRKYIIIKLPLAAWKFESKCAR